MRKRTFFIIIFLLILLVLLIMPNTYNSKKANKNYVSIIDNKELVIDNILPLSDEVGSNSSKSNGMANIYYKFKIKSNYSKKAHYKILLETEKGKQFINDRYIKVLLSDKDDNLFKEYKTDSVKVITGLNKYKSKYVIYSSSLKNKGEEEFILRMWISDASSYDDELMFDGKLSVDSY